MRRRCRRASGRRPRVATALARRLAPSTRSSRTTRSLPEPRAACPRTLSTQRVEMPLWLEAMLCQACASGTSQLCQPARANRSPSSTSSPYMNMDVSNPPTWRIAAGLTRTTAALAHSTGRGPSEGLRVSWNPRHEPPRSPGNSLLTSRKWPITAANPGNMPALSAPPGPNERSWAPPPAIAGATFAARG